MSVIFSRAPLRISLGGGGTDLPSYYREHGGFLVSGAIDKYVYMLTHTVFQRRYRMKYSELEEVDEISRDPPPDPARDTAAPLARQPAGDSLGRRRARGDRDGLLRRLHRLPAQGAGARAPDVDHAGDLAEAACEIEMDVLGEPVGKQDPYVAAHGGICAYTIHPRREGRGASRSSSTPRRCDACATTCCCSTRARRARPRRCWPTRMSAPRPATRRCSRTCTAPRSSACAAASCCRSGDLEGYAELMHEHWEHKRRRSPGMADEHIDRLYTLARRSGVIGGKLVGAGGGGFLLLYAPRPEDTRQAMAAAGAAELASTSSSAAPTPASTHERRGRRRGGSCRPSAFSPEGWARGWAIACATRQSRCWRSPASRFWPSAADAFQPRRAPGGVVRGAIWASRSVRASGAMRFGIELVLQLRGVPRGRDGRLGRDQARAGDAGRALSGARRRRSTCGSLPRRRSRLGPKRLAGGDDGVAQRQPLGQVQRRVPRRHGRALRQALADARDAVDRLWPRRAERARRSIAHRRARTISRSCTGGLLGGAGCGGSRRRHASTRSARPTPYARPRPFPAAQTRQRAKRAPKG